MRSPLFGSLILMILGIVIYICVRDCGKTGPDNPVVQDSFGRAIECVDGAILQIAPDSVATSVSTKLEILDARGRVVGILHVYADGQLSLEAPQAEPVRYLFQRKPDGSVALGIPGGRAEISPDPRHDGWMIIKQFFKSANGRRVQSFRIDAEGEIAPTNLDGLEKGEASPRP